MTAWERFESALELLLANLRVPRIDRIRLQQSLRRIRAA